MKRVAFALAAPVPQALAEAWVLGVVILLGYSRLLGHAASGVFIMGSMALASCSGMWAVVRCRLPTGRTRRQRFGFEVLLSVAVAAVMYTLRWPAQALGLNVPGIDFTLPATGLGFLCMRGALRLWLLWDGMRRRRMVWALTHAQILVIVLLAAVGMVGVVIASFVFRPVTIGASGADAGASFVTRLLVNVFPTFTILLFVTIMAIAAWLPPAMVFSVLVVRQTTRRLEALAAATAAMAAGDYGTRVTVAGEDEVAQLQANFNAMAEKLQVTLAQLGAERDRVQQLLAAQRNLVAGVSHDLRTPVATARATLESALGRSGSDQPPELVHDLAIANAELLRLQGLIDDLFTLARAEAGGLALECRPVDVRPVIERMVDAHAQLAWRNGKVELVADLPAALPEAQADVARLEQVLANLLRNAVVHTPPGGIVAVIARSEAGAVVIEVRDTGEGIPENELPRVFERFYRGDGGRARDDNGAGLGLAVVRELSEAMGGTVAAASVTGQGSCFTVRLPAVSPGECK